LFAYLASLVRSDKYEEALRLIKSLSAKGYQHKYFDLVIGLCYFSTMDFDNAKKHFAAAKEADELDATGARYLEQIDQHDYKRAANPRRRGQSRQPAAGEAQHDQRRRCCGAV
jgi:hypothetical protein